MELADFINWKINPNTNKECCHSECRFGAGQKVAFAEKPKRHEEPLPNMDASAQFGRGSSLRSE
jgi:hypothetical protein